MSDITHHLSKKIIDPTNLKERVELLRKLGKKIVTLNGSFDLLHSGHLHILFEAKKCGDVLIVALNTDASIAQYKGPKRPIIGLKERASMIAALEFVDLVTWFSETDPRALLEAIRPDVHVNGAEYGADCIESAVVIKHGGRLHLVERIEGLSTTAILNKMKQCV